MQLILRPTNIFKTAQENANAEFGTWARMKNFLGIVIGLGLMIPAIVMVRVNYESRPGASKWVSVCLTIGKLLLESLDGIIGLFSFELLWFGLFVIGCGIVLISFLGLFHI